MFAQELENIGKISYKEIAKPKIGFNDVLVSVKAAGICGSDIPRIYETGAHNMPIIPGHEFAGEVVCAPGIGSGWLGKRVGVFPLIPCRKCAPCLNRKYEMCRNYDYLGSRSNGAFAEFVRVPRLNLIELPDDVSYSCAAMLEPMAVAVHAIREVLKNQESIVVAGLGTIGLFVLMFLIEEKGPDNILVVGNKDIQKDRAIKMGLKEEAFCDIRKYDAVSWIKDKTEGLGSELYFECVGTNAAICQAVECTRFSGTVRLVGNPASDINFERDTYWKILRNQLSLKGTWNSSFLHDEEDDWNYVLRKVSEGRVNPEMMITHEFSPKELNKGFEIMKNKTEPYIKIMMKI